MFARNTGREIERIHPVCHQYTDRLDTDHQLLNNYGMMRQWLQEGEMKCEHVILQTTFFALQVKKTL